MVERCALPKDVISQIAAMKPIKPLFPIRFGAGVVNGLNLACPNCQTSVPIERVRGNISSFSHSASISGFAACPACKGWSSFEIRFRDDGSMLVKNEDGWEEIPPRSMGIFQRIFRYLRII